MRCTVFITLLVKESQDKIISWLATNGYTITVNHANSNHLNRSSYMLSITVEKKDKELTDDTKDAAESFMSQLHTMCGWDIPYHSLVCISPYWYSWRPSNIKMEPKQPKPKVNVPHLKVVKSEEEQKQD